MMDLPIHLPPMASFVVVWGCFAAALLMAWAYFLRYRMPQPPIGRINASDLALVMVVIVLIPYLHLLVAPWVNLAFLAVLHLSLFYLLAEPLLASTWQRLVVACLLLALGLTAASAWEPADPRRVALNNLLIVLAVVAMANLWVQSGLRAGQLAGLSMAIAAYDFVFTGRLPVTAQLFAKLDAQPFAPLIAWRVGEVWPAIGLGDTLLAACFVAVLHKAWGPGAAGLGLAAMLVCLPLLNLLPRFPQFFAHDSYPAMVLFAPVQALFILVCRRHLGAERSTAAFRAAVVGLGPGLGGRLRGPAD